MFSRREFLTTTAAIAASARLPRRTDAVPPPVGVVLFQGDSITDCGRDRASSQPNAAGALGNGYPLLVAAEALAEHPQRGLRFYNRGISGNKVPDLEARWAADTVALKPDVLSILIGVNDFWHKLTGGYTGTVQNYEDQYVALVDETRRALPHAQLVLLEPFVLRCGAVDDRWFPEFDARRAAAARVAKHARAAFIPLQSVFDRLARSIAPQYWAADGVHPTPGGHAVIAEQWQNAVHL